MKLAKLALLGSLGAALVACGDAVLGDANGNGSSSDPSEPNPAVSTSELGSVVADLRADTNRDGVVRFDDPTDDTAEPASVD